MPPSSGLAPLDRGVLLVDPDTGELWLEVNDLVVPAPLAPVQLTRVWDGDGWAWLGQAKLEIDEAGVVLDRPGEPPIRFPPVWASPLEPVCYYGTEVSDDAGRVLRCTEEGYVVEHANETVERFDTEGRLTDRRGGRGQVVSMTWSGDGLSSVGETDSGRISVSEARIVGSRLQRVARDPAGREVIYETDDKGRLVRVDGASGLRHRYYYDQQGRLQVLMWNDGSRVVIRWDDDGRVEGLEGPGHQRWRFEWAEDGLIRAWDGRDKAWRIRHEEDTITVSDPSGQSASLLIQDGRTVGWRDPAGNVTRLSWDEAGRLDSLKDAAGGRWNFRYHEQGFLVGLADPKGSTWQIHREGNNRLRIIDPAGRRRRLRLDATGLVIEVLEGGELTGFRRDRAGRVREIVHGTQGSTRIERDASGRITAVVDAAGGETRLDDWKGDTPGEIRDAGGGKWKLLFDSLARVSGVSAPDGSFVDWVRDTGGRLVVIQRDQARTRLDRRGDGAITRVVDPLGSITGWALDAVGRASSWRRPDLSQLVLARDSRGDLRSIKGDDRELQVQRDPMGRPVALVTLAEGEEGKNVLFTWTRDLVGRVREVTWPRGILELERDPAGRVRAVSMGERQWVLDRDAAGRLRAVREGEQAWVIARDDAGQVSGLHAPDALLIIDRDPRGLAARASLFGLELHWRRDAAGRPVRIDGPADVALGIQRNAAGKTVLQRLPGGAMLRQAYERQGLELDLSDSDGRPIHHWGLERDALGRIAVAWDDNTTRRYRYGPLGELNSIEEDEDAWSVFPGRREGPPGTLQLTTDPRGRPANALIELAAPVWGVARSLLDYELDGDGTVDKVVGDSGQAELKHDPLGRLVAVSIQDEASGEEKVSWQVRWDPFGRPDLILSQGKTTNLAFQDGRLLGLEEQEQGAVLLADTPFASVLAGAEGHVCLLAGAGNTRELALFSEGEPYVASSTPGGLRDLGFPSPLTRQGRFQLFPGGPLLGPTDTLDPLSGLPTSVPWAAVAWQDGGWPSPDEQVAWPDVDGATNTPWDPAWWEPSGPWSDPLALLLELGAIEPVSAGPWWTPTEASAPLPWMPASLGAVDPVVIPASGAWPMQEGDLPSLYLAAAARPARTVDLEELLEVLLARDLADLPQPQPGQELPAGIPRPPG